MAEIRSITENAPKAIAEAVRWGRRTKFNPLRSLSPASLTRSLECFERGELREAALLWDAIARRDDTIPSVKTKREKSVAHKPLETVTLEKSADADAHREVLEAFWKNVRFQNAWDRNDRGGVQKLIRSMQTAVSNQYGAHHIMWRPTAQGLRATFEYVPTWFFESLDGMLRFLPMGYGLEGQDLQEQNWMVSFGDGLMFASSIGYFLKRSSLQDWLRFSEKFAMPGVFGKTSAAKDSEEGQAMRAAVEAFGQEWAAVLYGHDGSSSSGIELIQANGNPAAMPMPALIERVDRKIAALYRGADLSTMSSNTGEGTGASVQAEEQDILERADAADRSEELQAIERTVIAWHFGADVEPLAQTRLIVPEREDQQLLLEATRTFVDMGAKIGAQGMLARFGISEADAEDTVLMPEGGGQSAVGGGAEPVGGGPLAVGGEQTPAANAAKDPEPVEIPLDRIAGLLLKSAIDGFEEAIDDDTTAGNTATTDAIWKDGEMNGGDRVPEGTGHGSRVTGTAANATAISPDAQGWYQIAPYGEFPTTDGKYIQVFGPEQAHAIVRHFNSVPFKVTRWLFNNEVPVFIGHPDVDRKAWADERKLATKHVALEAREDGLWGQAVWNALGQDNLENGYWQYPSPVWLFPKPDGLLKRTAAKLFNREISNRVFPDLLQSVGLTNFQNIPDARRVTHNAAIGTTQENEDDMNPELLAALGLDESATNEQVLAKIAEMKAAAESAVADKEKAAEMEVEISSANAALATARADLQTLRTTVANAMLDTAITGGAITQGERAGWEQRFATDYEGAANALAQIKPGSTGLNTDSVTLPGKAAVVPETPAARIAAVNAAVEVEMARNGGNYDLAHAAVKADPKMKPIFDAMNAARTADAGE